MSFGFIEISFLWTVCFNIFDDVILFRMFIDVTRNVCLFVFVYMNVMVQYGSYRLCYGNSAKGVIKQHERVRKKE